MMFKLLVAAEALQDMSEAFNWYEQQHLGLGAEFLDEVNEFFERITKNPDRYQVHRNQRVAILHRFPYKIVYEVEQDTIVVYAVYHDKRNPERLTERK